MEFVEIWKDILLGPFTTLMLGGKASFFAICGTEEDLIAAIKFSRENLLPFRILGGGSNTIVPDHGYEGLVIKLEILGLEEISQSDNDLLIQVGAGENWDKFVLKSLQLGLTGIECLSGIPGNVGACPIQNIGAYGQEVSESIESIRMIDTNLKSISVSTSECNFSYRNSRFKSGDWTQNIITHVTFRLSKIKEINFRYPEVLKKWKDTKIENANRFDELLSFRNLILNLRKSKSMVLDPFDANSKSVGSFFTNPFLTADEKERLEVKIKNLGLETPPFYPEQNNTFKISAAWLIENSGFRKGYVKNGVGISTAHSLALININGSTKSLLDLADEIKEGVRSRFNINLMIEPVILS